ncbi:NAD(P)-binding protein, partial [Streptomyces sp. NPDC005921]
MSRTAPSSVPQPPPHRISRRKLLGTTAALGATAALTRAGTAGAATTAAGTKADVTELTARAVVVGTGFGGGVTALRLAQAGVRTLVLERGRRWVTGPNATTFCRFANMDNRSAWLTDHSIVPGVDKTWTPYTGVIEAVEGNGMTANVGAAVGGGSITYHGMTLQPTEENFARSIPLAADFYDYLDKVAYPTVSRTLGVSPIPDDLLASDAYKSSRLFRSVLPKVGMQPFRVPLPIGLGYTGSSADGWPGAKSWAALKVPFVGPVRQPLPRRLPAPAARA